MKLAAKITIYLMLLSCTKQERIVNEIFYSGLPGYEDVCRYNCKDGFIFLDFCDRYEVGDTVKLTDKHFIIRKFRMI